MKKTFLITLASFSVFLIASCNKDPKSDKKELKEAVTDTTQVVAVEEEKPIEPVKKKTTKKTTKPKKKTVKLPAGMSSITDKAAIKYIQDYERYVANYKKAVEANDMDSFLKLNEASSSLTKQYTALMTKLSGEDIEKISNYMQEKSKQIDALSAQMN